MIHVDDRAGSRELYSPLLALGLKVTMCRLPYGDISFTGNGPDGIPFIIGIEHKQVSDVVKCIQDGRFAGHQLPGLLEAYNVTYLMVEGNTRAGRSGALQVQVNSHWCDQGFGNRILSYREFQSWLYTMELKGGIHLRYTRDQMDSAHQIGCIYDWWTRKEFSSHRSHLAFDEVAEAGRAAILIRPTTVRLIAAQLPGIGWERSIAVGKQFSSVVEMVAATEDEWCSIPGVGKVMAKRIMKELGSDILYGIR